VEDVLGDSCLSWKMSVWKLSWVAVVLEPFKWLQYTRKWSSRSTLPVVMQWVDWLL